jgi:hypothetical protein
VVYRNRSKASESSEEVALSVADGARAEERGGVESRRVSSLVLICGLGWEQGATEGGGEGTHRAWDGRG